MTRSDLAGFRETIESIWVAIILAFVLRAFVVEAFVIPTGSMAPRLMGQHVLLRCPDCKTEFPFGLQFDASVPGRTVTGPMARCPNCGDVFNYSNQAPLPKSGDRVLVLKYLYRFRQPRRWDVVVFRNPQNNEQNYIKRLAGLPGEVIRIIHGDVFFHENQDVNGDGVRDERDIYHRKITKLDQITQWQIARKDRQTQEAMWQTVFDNDFRPADERRRDESDELWQGVTWDLKGNHRRVFRYEGDGEQSLHFAQGRPDVFRTSNAYNHRDGARGDDTDICSDLKLETTLLPESSQGRLLLTLSHFDHQFAGEIGFDGRVRLLYRPREPAEQSWVSAQQWASAQVPALQIGRAVRVALSHADWQVILWVDGRPVLTSGDDVYHPDVPALVRAVGSGNIPTPLVAIIGAAGKFQLWHTRVLRDVFYTGPALPPPPPGSLGRYARANVPEAREGRPGWGTMKNPIALRAFDRQPDLDEFFMLGDNSPASLDSRLWVKAAPSLRLFDEDNIPQYRLGTVPRYNLLGKAFFVYWPAGTTLPGPGHLPIVPNVGKMRPIR